MNREEFNSATGNLDDKALRRVLWTIYWRAARICESESRARSQSQRPDDSRAPKPAPDGAELAREVADFVAPAIAPAMAQWYLYLLDNLDDTPDGVLDQIAQHTSLAGVEQTFFAAQLALRRSELATARQLVTECLRTLPRHSQFRAFAAEVGVETV
ncbi:hypothetical protein [Gordonia sp. (in: high G+C Gram-positive bacteria)]|uniref:hypothetical protein n=1 Tax=Gordonia sp. (in: high G+C Gram-positive bacteria) TaxID=84139 RepID=UPI00258112A6|nr:hypothetical protein [Gordonia sp. (in: high G+C Gram-positive bacteria)]